MGLSNFAFLLHLNIAWDGEGGEGSLSFSGSFLTCKDIICVCVFMLNIYGAHVWASDCVCWDASVHHMPQKAHLNTNCKTLVFYFPALERKPGPEIILPIHANGITMQTLSMQHGSSWRRSGLGQGEEEWDVLEHVCECQYRLGFCRDCRDALGTL